MIIEQTVEIPADRRLTINVPSEVPTGTVILTFTPKPEIECPICAKHRDPVTGNPRYNAETVAAIEEGMAISRGEIPAKRFNSLSEMLEDIEKDDDD
jgi:DNA-damage-inducible protein J